MLSPYRKRPSLSSVTRDWNLRTTAARVPPRRLQRGAAVIQPPRHLLDHLEVLADDGDPFHREPDIGQSVHSALASAYVVNTAMGLLRDATAPSARGLTPSGATACS